MSDPMDIEKEAADIVRKFVSGETREIEMGTFGRRCYALGVQAERERCAEIAKRYEDDIDLGECGTCSKEILKGPEPSK